MPVVDLRCFAHPVEVLVVYGSKEFHAPSDLPVNSTGIKNVDALGSFAVRVSVAEIVDIAEGFALLGVYKSL